MVPNASQQTLFPPIQLQPGAQFPSSGDADQFQLLSDSFSNLTLSRDLPGSPQSFPSAPSSPSYILSSARPTATIQPGLESFQGGTGTGCTSRCDPICDQPPQRQHPSQQNQQEDHPIISIPPLLVPPGENVIFAHSSFFSQNAPLGISELPSPSQVRVQAAWLNLTPTFTSHYHSHHGYQEQSGNFDPVNCACYVYTVPFPQLGLVVRFGRGVNASSEGKTLLLVRGALKQAGIEGWEKVPECFGWRRDGERGEGFLYFGFGTDIDLGSLRTLEEQWGALGREEKEVVCGEVERLVRAWRGLSWGIGKYFIGSIDRTPLCDTLFRSCGSSPSPAAGPFPSVSAFHDYLVQTALSNSQSRQGTLVAGSHSHHHYNPHHLFPPNVPITFTHSALHPRNILIFPSPHQPPKVVAILGWDQAGFYPSYWQTFKAKWECTLSNGIADWQGEWLPRVLDLEKVEGEVKRAGWSLSALAEYWGYWVRMIVGR